MIIQHFDNFPGNVEETLGTSFEKFVDNFSRWKNSGMQHYFFGKDAGFAAPKVFNRYDCFKHVHYVPDNLAKKWDDLWRYESEKTSSYQSRRTSNTFIVYAEYNNKCYLIHILTKGHGEIGTRDIPSDELKYMAEEAEDWILKSFIKEMYDKSGSELTFEEYFNIHSKFENLF